MPVNQILRPIFAITRRLMKPNYHPPSPPTEASLRALPHDELLALAISKLCPPLKTTTSTSSSLRESGEPSSNPPLPLPNMTPPLGTACPTTTHPSPLPSSAAVHASGSHRTAKKRRKAFDMSRYGQRMIALQLNYQGWRFHGFAAQPTSDNTVEAHLFAALQRTHLIENIADCHYTRAGRTDVGVSAYRQVVGLRVRSALVPPPAPPPPPPEPPSASSRSGEASSADIGLHEKIQKKSGSAPTPAKAEIDYVRVLNASLPTGIRITAWSPVCDGTQPFPLTYPADPPAIRAHWAGVQASAAARATCSNANLPNAGDHPKTKTDTVSLNGCTTVDPDAVVRRPGELFSARFDANSRAYKYFFVRARHNLHSMAAAARLFEGSHDFRNFCRIDDNVTNFERVMLSVQIRRASDDAVVSPKQGVDVDGTAADVSGNGRTHLDESGTVDKMHIDEGNSEDGMGRAAAEPGIDIDEFDLRRCDGDGEYEMFYIFVRGQAFLWHQVRCMAAVLLDIGLGREPVTTVRDMLRDASSGTGHYSKGRPHYRLASPIPLLLYDCAFPPSVVHFGSHGARTDEEALESRKDTNVTKGTNPAGDTVDELSNSSFERADAHMAECFTEEICKSSVIRAMLRDNEQLLSAFAHSEEQKKGKRGITRASDKWRSRMFLLDAPVGRHIPYEQRGQDKPLEEKLQRAAAKRKREHDPPPSE